MLGNSPPTSTVVSCSPATTCALVSTSPGRATHPEPSMARPQAVPSTRTTLREAARTPGERATAGSGGATSGEGPAIEGSGSRRASALRIGPVGGSRRLRSRRIAERWMSSRTSACTGACPATAATIHTIARPTAALRSAPSAPSSNPRPGMNPPPPSLRRSLQPIPSRPVAKIPPTSSAPISPNAGT